MELKVGMVCLYDGKPVYITEGAYEIGGRISNVWYWRDIKLDGTLGKKHSGYNNEGRFTEYKGKVKITFTLS